MCFWFWFKSVLWFQKKRWKCEIPIGSNVKLSRVMVAILNFRSANDSQLLVGALDNYSLVFVIFINFLGQLKDWVGQVLFSSPGHRPCELLSWESGRGPSSEHFWQVWLKSVQRFQRRRFKCEKLTDGRLPMTKAHMAYGQVFTKFGQGNIRGVMKQCFD
jgi:hypothetical protein